MPTNLIQETTSHESTFKSRFLKQPSWLLNVEDNVGRLKPKLVVAKECNGLKATKEALRVDSEAQAWETPQDSEGLDLEAVQVLPLSDLESIKPPRGKDHMSNTTK